MSGEIVVFAPLQFVLVVVVRQSVPNFEEGKGGIERPTNKLSKSGSNSAHSTGVLLIDYLVECLNHVGAAVALTRVATVARPPCLGAGAVAQGTGTGQRSSWANAVF